MKPRPLIVCLLAALAFVATGTPADARPHDGDKDRKEQSERPAVKVSLDQAVARAQKQFKARVVRTETSERDGHVVYILRLLNDAGRVWTVKVDATSGAMN